MIEENKHKTSSDWRFTAILSALLFGIILFLVSCMAWLVHIGIKTEKLTPFFLFSSPGVVIGAVCVISLILGLIIMSVVQKMLINPIGQMTEATQELAAGNFDIRIHLDSVFHPKEIAMFSEGFNKTAEALSSVEILRTDFINNFSHEFKTPIHSLVGIAELLKSGDCSPQEEEEYLDIIIDQAKRLASLSTNVLYLTKLETGTAPLEMEQLNLSELLCQKLVMFDHKCSEKALELETDIEAVALRGNGDLLSQMISNILDNAIKFSPEGGTVFVTLSVKGNSAVFRVRDQGCGMSRETMDRIFDKFYQGDASHCAEGFGLGLPMVKKIVELHRGRLNVESCVGKGSVFTIKLPMGPERS